MADLGGLGAISSVRDWLGTHPSKNHFGRNSAPPESFLAHQNRVRVAQLSNISPFDGSDSCGRNLRFTGFWGSGGLREISRLPGARSTGKVDFLSFSPGNRDLLVFVGSGPVFSSG